MPFSGAVSPSKREKELSENTHEVEVAVRSPVKSARFVQVRPSTRDEEQVDEASMRQYWREFFAEQRSKVKHSVASLDKAAISGIDSELKVTMTDPFVTSAYVQQVIDDAEAKVKDYIDHRHVNLIDKLNSTKETILRDVSILNQEVQ